MGNFNKKLVAIVLLVGVFGQAAAMDKKRARELSSASLPQPKRRRTIAIETVEPVNKPAIPSSFPIYSTNLPTEDQFAFSSKTYIPGAGPVLFITNSTEEFNKSEMDNTGLMVDWKESRQFDRFSHDYHQSKLSASIKKGDVDSTIQHLQKVPSVTPFVVSSIFSSDVFTESQKIQLISQLQTIGVNLNTSDPHVDGGSTPLHWATDLNQTELVRGLLRVGCNPNALDNHMQTPLFGTTSPETAIVLKRGGAELDHQDHKGRIALSFVGTKYQPDVRMAAFYALHNPHLIKHQDDNGETAFDRSERKFADPNEGIKDEEMARKYTIAPILFDKKNMGNPVFAQRGREMGMRFGLNNITL